MSSAVYRIVMELTPARKKTRYGDLDYDLDHSVDTTRANVNLRTQLMATLAGHPYFATEPWLFEQIMQALALSIQQSGLSQGLAHGALRAFTFIDVGSGKGRALLMAANYGFKRIIGVEFMPELHRVAQANIARCASERQQCRQIESICLDARDFQFPMEPLVLYLFNPFSEPTFAAVLENLRSSVEQAPRPVYVAYRFTEFEGLLAKADWLEKVAGTEQWAAFRNR
jgi:SAM-dependent methyltransferase